MLPSLRRARATYSALGEPYTEEPLDGRSFEKLLQEKFVTQDIVRDLPGGMRRLVRDETIRRMVREEIHRMSPQIAELVAD